MITAGWDIGGAHLKAAAARGGRIVGAWQVACPIWQGLGRLDAAFTEMLGIMRASGCSALDRHVCTMTAELSDVFASRAEGVAALAQIAARHLGNETRLYAARAGLVPADAAPAHADDIASANWHATATLVVKRCKQALVIDIGSTTTDIVPIVDGAVAAQGFSDAERLVAGELAYAGLVRSFVMAVAPSVPFKGMTTPLMHEYFANMADVYRILGQLPDGADLQATADGREKSVAASCARLARMIGRDAGEATLVEWRGLALAIKRAQSRSIEAAVLQVLSRVARDDMTVVTAGVGARVAAEIAATLGMRAIQFGELIDCELEARAAAAHCAPATALALLAMQGPTR